MNIYIEPEEFEAVLNLIVSLKTHMEDHNVEQIHIRSGEVDYGHFKEEKEE